MVCTRWTFVCFGVHMSFSTCCQLQIAGCVYVVTRYNIRPLRRSSVSVIVEHAWPEWEPRAWTWRLPHSHATVTQWWLRPFVRFYDPYNYRTRPIWYGGSQWPSVGCTTIASDMTIGLLASPPAFRCSLHDGRLQYVLCSLYSVQ